MISVGRSWDQGVIGGTMDEDERSSESDNQTPELRHRQIQNETEIIDEKENAEEVLISESEQEMQESDKLEQEQVQAQVQEQSQSQNQDQNVIPRVPRNIQPLQRPSFLGRQFQNVKNFFLELIEFILLL